MITSVIKTTYSWMDTIIIAVKNRLCLGILDATKQKAYGESSFGKEKVLTPQYAIPCFKRSPKNTDISVHPSLYYSSSIVLSSQLFPSIFNISTVPFSPSTRSLIPLLIFFIKSFIPTTHGIPRSRATTLP